MKDLYSDDFCRMGIKDEKTGFYADISMSYIEVPLMWLRKAAALMIEGNYKKGLHYIDMVEKRCKA